MAFHAPLRTTTLRAATVVCTVLAAGVVPAAAHAQTPPAAASPSPSPVPFQGLTPSQIADKAIAATKSATSLRLTGQVVSKARRVTLDLSLNQTDCTGTLKLQTGGTGQVRQTGNNTYIMGDDAFWRSSLVGRRMTPAQIDSAISQLHGKWLKIPPGQMGAQDMRMDMCNVKALAADLAKFKTGPGQIVRGRDGMVDNVPVATLIKRVNVTANGRTHEETTTLSVATHGKPYVLKAVKTGGAQPGSLVYSDFGKTVHVTAPPADQTVDVSKMTMMMTPSPSPS